MSSSIETTLSTRSQAAATKTQRIVILISGRGSNMQSIVRMAQARQDMEVVAVIANRADSAGLQWAKEQGISTQLVAHRDYPDRLAFDRALMACIDSYQPDWVILAGFMRILTDVFVSHYMAKLINIHPSLLPLFPGLDTHQRALEAGCTVHGSTVHFVTPELDAGPTIAQSLVPVLPSDDETSLTSRVLAIEHQLYPAVIDYLVSGVCYLDEQGQVQWTKPAQRLFAHPGLKDFLSN
ncbi:phosphoribosylglycinamide formyltransferase [Oligella urethralis]|uniref:phosphoribosylglycinamide formyltransferase n=1 Tax=Oligella urethralis TaxID=90245 RepID=UPI000E024459|nr:phosphoribosylglycinamide formyltransferase [Oligella urethralis]SUA59130.1 Phosphoribosylglycinamide formyltransferase [Oligella urethralis]